MSSIIESVMGMLSGDTLGKISQQTGIPKEKAQQAIPDVLAVLTGALAKNSSQQQGAAELSNALAKDHDGSLLNNLSDYIGHYQSGDGNGILGHVLGSKRDVVEESLGKKTGLDPSAIGNLLVMAAPIIMGALGKTQKQEGFSIGSLTRLLGMEQSQAQNIAPGASDILGKIYPSGSSAAQEEQNKVVTNKRSPIITIIVIIVLIVAAYFILRYLGIF